jgi:hypothetical protein
MITPCFWGTEATSFPNYSMQFYHLVIEDILKILKMEAAGPYETSVHIYQTIEHHIPEDYNKDAFFFLYEQWYCHVFG